jgi:hypothetical protein
MSEKKEKEGTTTSRSYRKERMEEEKRKLRRTRWSSRGTTRNRDERDPVWDEPH